MKGIVLVFFLSFSTYFFAQDATYYQKGSKELICHGAAVSVAGTIRPFVKRNISKSEIKKIIGDFVVESIAGSPDKAYDLFQSGKDFDDVVAILKADYMKLDEATVMQGLILDDEDNEYEYNDDDYSDD